MNCICLVLDEFLKIRFFLFCTLEEVVSDSLSCYLGPDLSIPETPLQSFVMECLQHHLNLSSRSLVLLHQLQGVHQISLLIKLLSFRLLGGFEGIGWLRLALVWSERLHASDFTPDRKCGSRHVHRSNIALTNRVSFDVASEWPLSRLHHRISLDRFDRVLQRLQDLMVEVEPLCYSTEIDLRFQVILIVFVQLAKLAVSLRHQTVSYRSLRQIK